VYRVTAQEMREIDRFTIEQVGIPAQIVMKIAGNSRHLDSQAVPLPY
jgi:NAD(P)H-hydrate repair Nnr-like enzyme with NAD(P)H-hydrate epimerase domain